MFPYHNRLKQLLNTHEYHVTVEKSPFAYRFWFPEICKSMPIREHRVLEYKEFLKEVNNG